MKDSVFIFLTLFNSIINLDFSVRPIVFNSVSVETILESDISIRAITIDDEKMWYAGDGNRFGYYDLKSGKIEERQVQNDTVKLEFRSIAQNSKYVFIASIGNPAFIYKIEKNNLSVLKVYTEKNERVFYDSMDFWNENEGIAVGDPTEDCLSILITRDGGNSWKKTSCANLPKVAEGEAAFAASNTNISIKGNKSWIVSGGKQSRVFYSADKGATWKVFETPLIQGKSMTGIFTADFYNDKIGVVAGGDYENKEQNFQNKAMTFDGGKTWELIADNSAFGYASCVQFVPHSQGKQLVCVGTSGLYYSADTGKTWKQLLDDKTLYTIRFLNQNTAFAAGKNKIVRIDFKK
ncbi:YCF48-related protein [Flavobacterium sp.]